MPEISNAEFVILSLIQERKTASGYQLNSIIIERGYREWADIGMTSIYGSLKKLERKNLIQGQLIKDKSLQGPVAKEFSLTKKGLSLLKAETANGLARTRERDRRFDLSISAMTVLSSEKAFTLITERITFLESVQIRISDVYHISDQNNSFRRALLFKHTLHCIKSEIAFLKALINNWEKEIVYDN